MLAQNRLLRVGLPHLFQRAGGVMVRTRPAQRAQMPRTMLRRKLAYLLLILPACGYVIGPEPGDTVQSDGLGKPSIEVGGSRTDGVGFVPWRGQNFQPAIIHGPQGGHHIWLSVKTKNLWKDKLLLTTTMFLDASPVKPGPIQRIVSVKPQGEYEELDGLIHYVDNPADIVGKNLRVTVDALDLYGVVTSDTAFITPTWDGK